MMNMGYRRARATALHNAGRNPTSLQAAIDTANQLRAFNLGEVLLNYVKRLGPVERLPIPLLLSLARNLSALNMQSHALTLLDEAKRGDPDFPPVLLARAQVLMYMARIDEAKADVLRCLARAPEFAHGWWLLSHMETQAEGANHVDEIRSQLARPGRRVGEIALLQNALHKELDDLRQYREAWGALERFCEKKRSTFSYDSSESKALIDALIAVPQSPPRQATSEDARVPIFIVGMHRSGTTLLEQLLDASPQVKGIGELYDFTSAMRHVGDYYCRGVIDNAMVTCAHRMDLSSVGKRYLKDIAWRLGDEPFFTDKLPSNFLNIGFICGSLPEAKILHMVRDPMETCFSNLRELFSDVNPYSYDQRELASYFLQYRRLMAHWHKVWPGKICDVSYAELTRDTESVMRKVCAFCGINYVPEMRDPRNSIRAVATASAMQVRDRVVHREVPKWKDYDEHLQPLADILLDDERGVRASIGL